MIGGREPDSAQIASMQNGGRAEIREMREGLGGQQRCVMEEEDEGEA